MSPPRIEEKDDDQDSTDPPRQPPSSASGDTNRSERGSSPWLIWSALRAAPEARSRNLTSRIAYREVDYGDHGLGFFDVFVEVDGEERQIVSVAARAIAEIHYAQPS